MCMIYSVGPDSLCSPKEYETGFKWLVYHYTSDGYEGSGEIAGLHEDGLLYFKDLGHCSCYSALGGWPEEATKHDIQEFLRDKEDIMDIDARRAVKDKVKELLQAT